MHRSVFVALLLVALANAHTHITQVYVNNQAVGTSSMRASKPGYDTFPIQDRAGGRPEGITSQDYTCGFLPWAAYPSASKLTVAAGSTIGVTYQHDIQPGENNNDRYIAFSHKGPILAYMAKSETGYGSTDWFKIFHEGKNGNKWASPDTLLANGGTIRFVIPSDIAPGNYLLRTELIALHDNLKFGSQPYVTCFELVVTGNGNARPVGIAIPGTITNKDKGLSPQFNVWAGSKTYPIPGPKVYVVGKPYVKDAIVEEPADPIVNPTEASKVEVHVSVQLAVASTSFELSRFVYVMSLALGIPETAVTAVSINQDRSTDNSTVVSFTIENVWNPSTSARVEPVGAAKSLQDMAASDDERLNVEGLLRDVQVLSVSEPVTSAAVRSVASIVAVVSAIALALF